MTNPSPGRVDVGDEAPDFSLPAQDGSRVSLRDYRGRAPVVLYFYPRDFTPNCTTEACSFRDLYADFQDAGAVVLGVSSDPPDLHVRFAERHRLPFRLLSDEGGAVRRRYGIPATLGVLDGRVTFVIDRAGVVRHRFASQLRPRKHVRDALEVLRGLDAGSDEARATPEPPRRDG